MVRAVVQLDKDNGKKIAEYESVEEAAAETGEDIGVILACCYGDLIHDNNYIWVEAMQYTMSNHGFEY